MSRARAGELFALGAVVVAQAVLFARPLSSATNYDEDVYLAALDALRHGQALGSHVFAAQFPGFYDLLRGLSYVTGVGVENVRAGLLAVTLAGTIGGWLVQRRAEERADLARDADDRQDVGPIRRDLEDDDRLAQDVT